MFKGRGSLFYMGWGGEPGRKSQDGGGWAGLVRGGRAAGRAHLGGWLAGRHRTEERRLGEQGQRNWEGEGRRSFQDNLRLKDRPESGISTG